VPVHEGALVVPPAHFSVVTARRGSRHLRIHSDLLVFARGVQGSGPAEERR
jgi:hypothetical protein